MQLPHWIFISKLVEICFAILWLYSKPEILNSLKSSNNSLGYLLPEKLTPAMSMYMLLYCTNLLTKFEGFPDGTVVKNLPANAGDVGSIPESGRSLGKGMTTHSSILAWEMLWTEEPGGLQSTGAQKSRSWLGNKTTTTLTKFTIQASAVPVTEKSAEWILIGTDAAETGLGASLPPWVPGLLPWGALPLAHSCECCTASASAATATIIDLGPSLPRAYAPSLDKCICAGKPCPCLVPATACEAPGLTLHVCRVGYLPAHQSCPISLSGLTYKTQVQRQNSWKFQ